uniref:uncharacterized protein LOC120336723 n=1 Tax=Styela clava TaxID=7725 RepID=UPI001939631E|nr:uncharacterized protein LOC120336723 [Styela clava]
MTRQILWGKAICLFIFLSYARAKTPEVCEYNGNMCDVSTECLGKLWNDANTYGCRGMTYPTLYETRGKTEFWIGLSRPQEYNSSNLTFSVVQEIDHTWSNVQGCCSLRLGEFCELPPFKKQGSYHIFAPYGRNKHEYCEYEIQEYQAVELKWCFLDDEGVCLSLDDGVIHVDEKFGYDRGEITSIDFLFFEVPSKHGQLGDVSPDGVTVNIPNITLDGNNVYVNNSVVKADMVKNTDRFNILEHFEKHNTSCGKLICVFYRINRFHNKFSETPICASADLSSAECSTSEGQTPTSSINTPVIVVFAMFGVIILIIIAVIKRNSCHLPLSQHCKRSQRMAGKLKVKTANFNDPNEKVGDEDNSKHLLQNGDQSLV